MSFHSKAGLYSLQKVSFPLNADIISNKKHENSRRPNINKGTQCLVADSKEIYVFLTENSMYFKAFVFNLQKNMEK